MLCWHNIFCWSVGRGEATIASFNDGRLAQIIDFGTNPPLNGRSRYAVIDAKNICKECDIIDVVITHFHFDHYSLIPLILGSKPVRATYIPPIPRPKPLMEALLYLIATQAELLLMKGIVALDEIAKRSQRVYFVYRGVRIRLNRDLYVRILWPPLELPPNIAERAMEKLRPAYVKAKKLVEKAKIENRVERRFRELYEAVNNSTLKGIRKHDKEDERAEPIEAGEGISSSLPALTKEAVDQEQYFSPEELEFLEKFRDAINDFSLVLKHYYRGIPLTLISGDNSDYILDLLSKLEKNEPKIHKYVVFMKGSHHGTYFGKYLEEHRALITWLSWTKRLNHSPHASYITTSPLTLTAEQIDHLNIHVDCCFHIPPFNMVRAYVKGWRLHPAKTLIDIVVY